MRIFAAEHPVARSMASAVAFVHDEIRVWAMALIAPLLYVVLLALALVVVTAVWRPMTYSIDAGYEEGYGSDLPYLRGFNTAESDMHGTFRWTDDGAAVLVPNVGERALLVQFDFIPISAEVVAAGPTRTEVRSNGEHLATLPVDPNGRRHTFLVPQHILAGGDLSLVVHTDTFAPPGDPRQLGTPLDSITLASLQGAAFVAPNWSALGAWALATLFAWLTLLRTLATPHRWATWLFVGLALLASLAALLDPPRWAFGAQAALAASALCYVLAIALQRTLPLLARRLSIPGDECILGWLALFIVLAFGLRYGGRLYPNSMHGDIWFHSNRFTEMANGLIFILSRNRGVDFPYPPGPYLLLAPFTLAGFQPYTLLQYGAALVDGLSGALIYAIVARTLRAPRTALLAAAIYVFTAATFMTAWWSFDTHIYTQFTTLLFIAALALTGAAYVERRPPVPGAAWPLVGVILTIVLLGHFGFFINTALLSALLVGLIWLFAWRDNDWKRDIRRPLIIAVVGSGTFALVFFYSAYASLFASQIQTATTDGLTGLAQRIPVSRAHLWSTMWEAGFITHFGFFPVPLALIGMTLLWKQARQRQSPAAAPAASMILWTLMAGSFLISSGFALLPFITLSTQSTRWLMFSAWAITIGAALAVRQIWHMGGAGRLVTFAMAGIVIWNTAQIWLGPMLWRIRPPEPF